MLSFVLTSNLDPLFSTSYMIFRGAYLVCNKQGKIDCLQYYDIL